MASNGLIFGEKLPNDQESHQTVTHYGCEFCLIVTCMQSSPNATILRTDQDGNGIIDQQSISIKMFILNQTIGLQARS